MVETVDVSRLEALEREVADLRSRVLVLENRRAVSSVDVEALTAILPALAGARGSEWFTIGELRASDADGVRLVLAGWSSRRLGKLFARAAGLTVDGFVLEHAGKSHSAALWRVLAVVGEFHTPQTPRPPSVRLDAMRPSNPGD